MKGDDLRQERTQRGRDDLVTRRREMLVVGEERARPFERHGLEFSMHLLTELDKRALSPAEAAACAAFLNFAASGADVFSRARPDGHFTASCWLVSSDGERVLLTHHRKLGRWLQLGGHADDDSDLAAVCLREAQEESGIAGLEVEAQVFDIDAHAIPSRALESAHTHWDVRFVVHCRDSERWELSDESLALAWKPIVELAVDPAADASLRRMAHKWLLRSAR